MSRRRVSSPTDGDGTPDREIGDRVTRTPPFSLKNIWKPLLPYWPAVFVLGLAVVIGMLSYGVAMREAERDARHSFEMDGKEVRDRLERQLNTYAGLLRDSRALFAASNHVDRGEWAAFVEAIECEHRYPGVFGLAFVERVHDADLDAWLEAVRADGAPGFRLHAPMNADFIGPIEHHYIIKYHEPAEINRVAWGIDIACREENRRTYHEAMLRNEPQLSQRIMLTQGGGTQAGVVLSLPVYHSGAAIDTPQQREAALMGWTAVPIGIDTLMHREGIYRPDRLRFVLTDDHGGDRADLYRSPDQRAADTDLFVYEDTIAFGGRTLRVRLTPVSAATFPVHGGMALVLLCSVLLIGLTLAAMTVVLLNSRHEARREAKQSAREVIALRAAMDKHTLFSIADRSGRIIDVNEGFCRISGYTREELLGQDHRMLNSGHHPKPFWVDMWKTIASGEPWRAEVCNRAKDGTLYWVDSTNIPQFDENGEIDRYISLRFDITSRKEMESEIEDTRAKFERATTGTSDGLWDYDIQRDRFWYSNRFLMLLGLEEDAFASFDHTKAGFAALLHPDDRERVLDAVEALIADDVPYDAEYRLRMPDDEYRWFRARASCTRNDRGEPERMSGSLTDIHEQHTMRSRLDLATRAADIGLWDWDVPSGTMFFSDTFSTMLGYEPGELPMTLKTWSELIHPDDLERALADIEAHQRGETPAYANEQRLRRKDGTYAWIRDIGEVVERNADGSPKRMIGVHMDIQTLRDAIERAEGASKSKSEFLANMSHEIRTPMTAILGYADLLGSDGDIADDPKKAADAVRTIRANADHLLTIINDILDVSKIEAGQLSLELIETNASEIAREAVALIEPRAKSKGVDVKLVFDGEMPAHIESDPTRLRQILLNLLGNAVKFTEHGSVTLRLSCDPRNWTMRFDVIDTGVGMKPEQLARVSRFDAFEQGDSSMSRRFGGTGLGLRISNALAIMLGGGIAVESELGEGSTFSLTIGTGDLDDVEMVDAERVGTETRREAQSSDGTSSQDGRTLDGLRILLAEDGPDNQRLIAFHLKKAGARVTVADNGRVALETVMSLPEDDRPHVILMDMQMPEMDGYTATSKLRERGVILPILALTAHAMDGDRERCLDAGCDDFMTKPIDKKVLVETCAKWASRAADEDAQRRAA